MGDHADHFDEGLGDHADRCDREVVGQGQGQRQDDEGVAGGPGEDDRPARGRLEAEQAADALAGERHHHEEHQVEGPTAAASTSLPPSSGTWEATTTSMVAAISGTVVVVAASETFCTAGRRAAHICRAQASARGTTISTRNARTNGPPPPTGTAASPAPGQLVVAEGPSAAQVMPRVASAPQCEHASMPSAAARAATSRVTACTRVPAMRQPPTWT